MIYLIFYLKIVAIVTVPFSKPNISKAERSGDAVELAEMSARDVRTSSKYTTVEAERTVELYWSSEYFVLVHVSQGK